MKIDSIKKLKSGKYKIILEGQSFITYDDVIIKNGVLYKKNIDEETFNKMIKDNEYYDAYNKTISYIMKHKRTEYEIIKYLKKYDISLEDENRIINHLKDIGLINDTNYIKSFIQDAIYLGNNGPLKIKQDLIDLGLNENLVLDEIQKIDNNLIENNLIKLIDKKFKGNNKHSLYQLKQKIMFELVNKGYDRDMIQGIIQNYNYDDNSLMQQEYNKIYNKLSKKYEGYDLFNRIKQKLYVKGFDINKINELIQEKTAF